jgi:hypothetical protein
VCTPYMALCSFFPFRTWWKFLLMSAIFWMINRVCFELSPTDAEVHPAVRFSH